MSKKDSSELVCEKCGEVLPSEKEMNEHIQAHIRAAEMFKCESCSTNFNTKEELVKHMENVHPKNKS